MKKLLVVLILLLTIIFIGVNSVSASVKAPNGQKAPEQVYSSVYDESYYSGVVGKSGDDLLEGLALISYNNHKYYNRYDETKGGMAITDLEIGSTNTIRDFYTGVTLSHEWSGNTNWNREHLWCTSLSGGLFDDVAENERGAGADIHHIRPEMWKINNNGRNNAKYAEVKGKTGAENYEFTNPYTGKTELSGCYRIGVTYFEPNDISKGDVARILMYLYMHYSNENNLNTHQYAGSLIITNVVYTSTGTSQAAWDLLCKWNEADPVDEWEVERHKKCVEMTGVRNPFIDHPEFADMIWDKSYSGSGALKDSDSSTDIDYASLLEKYFNKGVYTKKTNIYLKNNVSVDLSSFFHGGVAKERTTYYNGSYLLMGDIDGRFNTINSGYRNSGDDINHFTYKNGSVVDDYVIEDSNIHYFYVTMDKLKEVDYLDSSWVNGVHNVTSIDDEYLADFLAFTAPCLKDNVLTSNYLNSNGIKLKIEEMSNSFDEYLSLKMYVSSTDSSKVDGDLLSEARIYKDNVLFDDSNLKPDVDTSNNSSNSGSSSGGSSSGSTTTQTKQSYSYTFTSKIFSKEETKTLGEKNWTVSGTDGAYYGYSGTKGHQFGSANNPFTKLNLTVTTNFTNISSVYITACGASGTTAKLDMYLGETSFGTRTLTEKSKTFMFTPKGASGRVSFKFTQSATSGAAKAIYIKEIRVYYTSGVTATYNFSNIGESNQLSYISSTIEDKSCEQLFDKYSSLI